MAERTIAEVQARHEAELFALPNVKGVGIGERAGRPVIKVWVERKVRQSLLAPEERVPASLEGFEVDVEEIGDIEAQSQ